MSECPILLCLSCRVKFECTDNAEDTHNWLHDHFKHSVIVDYDLEYYNILKERDDLWQ